jgi:cytochrome c-type biogenesis protein CcmH
VATAAPDAGLLADYADALAAANNGKFNDKARALVKQALAADPRDPKALSLAGTIAYDDGDFAGAAAHWTILRDALPEGPQRAGIERSLAEAGQAGAPPTPTPPLLGGEVTLAPTLRARLEPSDQLFIVARSTDSTGGPPLAVRRMPAVFPAAFTLSDAESMLSDSKLSNVRAVSLTAHIAKAGSRTAAAPDLAVRLEHVAVGSLGLRLAIGQAVQ